MKRVVRRCFPVFCAVLLLATLTGCPEMEVGGTWKHEYSGNSYYSGYSTLGFFMDSFTMTSAMESSNAFGSGSGIKLRMENIVRGTFKVDKSTTPMRMDMTIKAGEFKYTVLEGELTDAQKQTLEDYKEDYMQMVEEEKGTVSKALFQRDGDTLKFRSGGDDYPSSLDNATEYKKQGLF